MMFIRACFGCFSVAENTARDTVHHTRDQQQQEPVAPPDGLEASSAAVDADERKTDGDIFIELPRPSAPLHKVPSGPHQPQWLDGSGLLKADKVPAPAASPMACLQSHAVTPKTRSSPQTGATTACPSGAPAARMKVIIPPAPSSLPTKRPTRGGPLRAEAGGAATPVAPAILLAPDSAFPGLTGGGRGSSCSGLTVRCATSSLSGAGSVFGSGMFARCSTGSLPVRGSGPMARFSTASLPAGGGSGFGSGQFARSSTSSLPGGQAALGPAHLLEMLNRRISSGATTPCSHKHGIPGILQAFLRGRSLSVAVAETRAASERLTRGLLPASSTFISSRSSDSKRAVLSSGGFSNDTSPQQCIVQQHPRPVVARRAAARPRSISEQLPLV